VRQGRLRALAVTGAKRSPAVPDVPTLLESGVKVEANLWTGLFAPEGTPKPVLNRLNGDIGRAADAPAAKQWLLNNLRGHITPNTPDQFAAFLAADSVRWQKIIKQIDLHLDKWKATSSGAGSRGAVRARDRLAPAVVRRPAVQRNRGNVLVPVPERDPPLRE